MRRWRGGREGVQKRQELRAFHQKLTKKRAEARCSGTRLQFQHLLRRQRQAWFVEQEQPGLCRETLLQKTGKRKEKKEREERSESTTNTELIINIYRALAISFCQVTWNRQNRNKKFKNNMLRNNLGTATEEHNHSPVWGHQGEETRSCETEEQKLGKGRQENKDKE